MKDKHPKLPYEHNMDKKCKVDGCNELGFMVRCNFCGKFKRKTLCRKHLIEHREMNRIYRGKLTSHTIKGLDY